MGSKVLGFFLSSGGEVVIDIRSVHLDSGYLIVSRPGEAEQYVLVVGYATAHRIRKQAEYHRVSPDQLAGWQLVVKGILLDHVELRGGI